MKIAIISAMSKELNLLLNIMENVKESDRDGLKIYEGQVGNHVVTAMQCGIGKVNSAINTFKMIQSEHPDLVINSGVAGGADSKMKVGSILVADKVAYHDVWCGPGTKIGEADGMPLYLLPSPEVVEVARQSIPEAINGLICSGDRFINLPSDVRQIKSNFPDALAVDMESASIAQTCIMENTPFAIIRVMSDTPGEQESVDQYTNFWTEAPEKTFHCLINLIHNLK